ncbi:hypothetical protein [Mechercharimyces sp. CAU 1602]|uniref:hypothetical protein n=1 Tax=Mechercharimyces sp. CAU 1602 TaxID=2973933 RepID=UPI00216334B7|nr:hypothetical protein [Mechercharimyces sp. CAU 1602]MCS1350889.1 hypothetical protein [Mechercharimyces sp. CAU 1602]
MKKWQGRLRALTRTLLGGQCLSMTHPEQGESYYGTNTCGDVEMLCDEKGNVRGTYGYTLYGEDQQNAFTGVDKKGIALYNPYRYKEKRWDAKICLRGWR